jgi:hypothetical protein
MALFVFASLQPFWVCHVHACRMPVKPNAMRLSVVPQVVESIVHELRRPKSWLASLGVRSQESLTLCFRSLLVGVPLHGKATLQHCSRHKISCSRKLSQSHSHSHRVTHTAASRSGSRGGGLSFDTTRIHGNCSTFCAATPTAPPL